MSAYPEEKINEVKEAVDLVELISHYVNLKRSGANYMGLCPFHSEKTPSFTVSPQRGFFHCFGCGAGGDAIHFLMKVSDMNFPEAVAELARRYGVELPEPEGGWSGGRVQAENKAGIYEVLKAAQEFFTANLWSREGREALRYLARRGLNQRTTREFGLGLAWPGWNTLTRNLTEHGFGEKIMLEAGLVKPGREGLVYDAFRNRLMVPIFDAEGRVAAFGGRLLSAEENQPKYLNSPETAVYKKGRLLYGHHRARPFLRAAGMVFMVEGYFDLIAMTAAGINEVVATLGTALTSGHLNLLKGHVREVMLLFDSDEAGQRAAGRALPLLLNAELDGRVVRLPEGHDPDTFVREFGAEALYEAAGKAIDILDFQVARLKQAHPATLAGQARTVRDAREILGQVTDSAKSRLLRKRLVNLLDLDEDMLGQFKSHVPRPLSHTRTTGSDAGPDFDKVALEFLRFILIHPETAPDALTEMAAYWPADATRPVFDRLKAACEDNGRIMPEDAAGDDPEAITAAISAAAFADREWEADQTGPLVREYIKRMIDKWKQKRQLEITRDMTRAAEAGDQAEMTRLFNEKKSLQGK